MYPLSPLIFHTVSSWQLAERDITAEYCEWRPCKGEYFGGPPGWTKSQTCQGDPDWYFFNLTYCFSHLICCMYEASFFFFFKKKMCVWCAMCCCIIRFRCCRMTYSKLRAAFSLIIWGVTADLCLLYEQKTNKTLASGFPPWPLLYLGMPGTSRKYTLFGLLDPTSLCLICTLSQWS